MRSSMFLMCLCLGLLGCTAGTNREECSAELLQADRAFAKYSADNGPVTAFEQYLTEDGLQLPNGAPPIFGRSAIVASMASGPSFGLEWEPQHAEAAAACDLGWTWGTYEATFEDSLGATVTSTGKYLNVWRRVEDGSWRVVVDAGNQSGETPRRMSPE